MIRNDHLVGSYQSKHVACPFIEEIEVEVVIGQPTGQVSHPIDLALQAIPLGEVAVHGGMYGGHEKSGRNVKPSGRSRQLHEERDAGQLNRIMADLDTAMSGVDEVARWAGDRYRRDE